MAEDNSQPFFPSSYFDAIGGLSGIGYPAGITYPSQGGYFPGRYFAPTYFAPTYFPSRPIVPIPPMPSFIAAVRQWIRDDAALMSDMPGDWWNRQIARGQPEPAGFYLVMQSPEERIGGQKYMVSGKLQISVYAPESRTAVRLADRTVEILKDAPLKWTKGSLMYLSPADISSPAGSNAGIGGAAVQGENRVLDFQYHGEY